MLLVIFFSLTVSVQNKYAKLDKIARTKIPIEHNSTPGKIASYLISFAKNDEEKARILFVYSTHVLRYDIRRSGKNASASWSIKNGVGAFKVTLSVCLSKALIPTSLKSSIKPV